MATLNEICRDLALRTAAQNAKQGTRAKVTAANLLVMSPASLTDLARSLGGLVT